MLSLKTQLNEGGGRGLFLELSIILFQYANRIRNLKLFFFIQILSIMQSCGENDTPIFPRWLKDFVLEKECMAILLEFHAQPTEILDIARYNWATETLHMNTANKIMRETAHISLPKIDELSIWDSFFQTEQNRVNIDSNLDY